MKNNQWITLNNGVKIPPIGFGTWKSPQEELTSYSVKWALDAGFRLIDTASAYQNEEYVGKGLKMSSLKREDYFVTTKLPNYVRGYDETIKEFNSSLNRLGLTYIDLYLIHWPRPISCHDDYISKDVESYKAMEYLLSQGKIKAIGVSNFMPHHLSELMSRTTIVPSVDQILLFPGQRHENTRQFCSLHNIQLEAYSPLGKPSLLSDQRIIDLAAKYKVTPAQLLLIYQLNNHVIPLVKSVHQERIVSNYDVFNKEISKEDMSYLDNLSIEKIQTEEYIDNITF